MIKPKSLSCLGEYYLKEAILDVLCEAYSGNEGVSPAEISRRAGIFRESGVAGMNDAITHGLLNSLVDEGKVERVKPRKGWRLTEEEFERRRNDMDPG